MNTINLAVESKNSQVKEFTSVEKLNENSMLNFSFETFSQSIENYITNFYKKLEVLGSAAGAAIRN